MERGAGPSADGQLPPELRPHRRTIDAYVATKLRSFADAFTARVSTGLSAQQLDAAVADTFSFLAVQEAAAQGSRGLRLVIQHDCLATGCGDSACHLCQYNPSRVCKRQLKTKYLIDDHLKAKCGANLIVEVVDEAGSTVTEGLPPGTQLELMVLNGEKYKEVVPEGNLLPPQMLLQQCIIGHHTRALLKREGGPDDALRCFLHAEGGRENLSELLLTTSSEALLAGKAPTFRLLLWAVDGTGRPVPHVTHVVSESFVHVSTDDNPWFACVSSLSCPCCRQVATKRVKHAIKSDIPSITDSVNKLVHVGKATVDKLADMRTSSAEEGYDLALTVELWSIENIGQFQGLVEATELNGDLKAKVRHMLKLSPEKWDEVAAHAMAAVAPDFRPRVWRDASCHAGLVFATKHGSVVLDRPVGYVRQGGNDDGSDLALPLDQLDPLTNQSVPALQQQAAQAWYMPSHPGWAIHWDGPGGDIAPPLALPPLSTAGGGGMQSPMLPIQAAPTQQQQQHPQGQGQGQQGPGMGMSMGQLLQPQQPQRQQQQQPVRASAFAALPTDHLLGFFPPLPASSGGGGGLTSGVPSTLEGDSSMGRGAVVYTTHAGAGDAGASIVGGLDGHNVPSIDMLKSDLLPGLEGGNSLLWGSLGTGGLTSVAGLMGGTGGGQGAHQNHNQQQQQHQTYRTPTAGVPRMAGMDDTVLMPPPPPSAHQPSSGSSGLITNDPASLSFKMNMSLDLKDEQLV
ncbi:hypothetical protein FOA52_015324 [Chlamydomonas sp. UWO 241]|nr:hypothetical protein FOA52_015324 [Chlamydomonas sp. UWO 241]